MTGPARDALILEFLPLARHEACKWAHKAFLDPSDILGESMLGLIEAADKYDPAKGSFTAFARIYIRGRLNRASQKAPIVRGSGSQLPIDPDAIGVLA